MAKGTRTNNVKPMQPQLYCEECMTQAEVAWGHCLWLQVAWTARNRSGESREVWKPARQSHRRNDEQNIHMAAAATAVWHMNSMTARSRSGENIIVAGCNTASRLCELRGVTAHETLVGLPGPAASEQQAFGCKAWLRTAAVERPHALQHEPGGSGAPPPAVPANAVKGDRRRGFGPSNVDTILHDIRRDTAGAASGAVALTPLKKPNASCTQLGSQGSTERSVPLCYPFARSAKYRPHL